MPIITPDSTRFPAYPVRFRTKPDSKVIYPASAVNVS